MEGESKMFKIFHWRIATEAEVQKLIDNTFKTAARLALAQSGTIEPPTQYGMGRRDAAADIMLMVQP